MPIAYEDGHIVIKALKTFGLILNFHVYFRNDTKQDPVVFTCEKANREITPFKNKVYSL